MEMDETEILWNYRNAANPKKMIKILAELNDCSKKKIREILEKNGAIPVKEPKNTNAQRWTKQEDKILIDGLAAGMNSSQVKELLPKRSVRAIRSRVSVLGMHWRKEIKPENIKYLEFQRTFKYLKNSRNLEDKDIAFSLDVGMTTISNWKRGVKLPSDKNMEKLAEYFGVSIDYLLGKDVEGK